MRDELASYASWSMWNWRGWQGYSFLFLVKVSIDFRLLISLFSYLNSYFRSFQYEQLVDNLSEIVWGRKTNSFVEIRQKICFPIWKLCNRCYLGCFNDLNYWMSTRLNFLKMWWQLFSCTSCKANVYVRIGNKERRQWLNILKNLETMTNQKSFLVQVIRRHFWESHHDLSISPRSLRCGGT
jgi:hypothetical protein